MKIEIKSWRSNFTIIIKMLYMYCCLVLHTTYPPYNPRIAVLPSIILLILYIHQQSGFMVHSNTSFSLSPNNLNTAQSLPCSSPLLLPRFWSLCLLWVAPKNSAFCWRHTGRGWTSKCQSISRWALREELVAYLEITLN